MPLLLFFHIFALLKYIGHEETDWNLCFADGDRLSESGTIEQTGDESGRSTEERTDTVDIEVTPEGWAGSIDTGFEF